MAQVPQRVLSWLWSVLQTYSQAQTAYGDIAASLAAYPSLQPRTSVHTFDNGQSALLLCLSGTLPVDFRGSQYRFPVEVWIPQEYGERGVGIMCYVRPGDGKNGTAGDIVIRPGQHVAIDGKIYHPYLKDWNIYGRSSIVEFLRIAQQVFAKEPPVMSKQQSMHGQFEHQRPPPPPKERVSSIQSAEMPGSSRPPPLPVKPGQDPQSSNTSAGQRSRGDGGPPLPPLPHQRAASGYDNRNVTPPRQQPQQYSLPHADRNVAPALPPLPPHIIQEQMGRQNGERSPVSPLSPASRSEPHTRYQQPPPVPQYANGIHTRPSPLQQPLQSQMPQQTYQHPSQQYQQAPVQQQPQRQQQQQQQYPPQGYAQSRQPIPDTYQRQPQPQQIIPPQQRKAAPAPDLLSDPFDISLPTSSQRAAAPPPIPPNPEKEHLLAMLSQTLVAQVNTKLQQNASAIAPLQAQNVALQEAHTRLNAEIAQLQALDSVLSTNEAILHQSLRDCDKAIESSTKTPAPNIDDVLVAPTVASQQLWNLCAEEAAIREALWCLQRAVDAGRVSGPEFVRLTRGLAREAFLKMALARKLAKGLGLDLGPGKEAFDGM